MGISVAASPLPGWERGKTATQTTMRLERQRSGALRKGNVSEALWYALYKKLFLFPMRARAECDRCRVTAPVER